MVSLCGEQINLFIERGPALGPVLEVTVDSVEEAKQRLLKQGCKIVKDEPEFPRCYIKDPYGLIYNLNSSTGAYPDFLPGGAGHCRVCCFR